MTASSNPISWVIDLTDDDPNSAGNVLWSNANSTIIDLTNDTQVVPTPFPGPSQVTPMNYEYETEEYMAFLQQLQDEFNNEPYEPVTIPDPNPIPEFHHFSSSITPFSNVSNNQNAFSSTPQVPVAGSSRMDVDNNDDVNNNFAQPGTSKATANTRVINKSDFPVFEMLEMAPASHKYFRTLFTPTKKNFLASVNKDRSMLQNDLPAGIYVKMFENRLDLISTLIEGPINTPYEGCLFTFDIQLSNEHPNKPPRVHFHAFSTEKLNPNLYTSGMVCLSLLGTWSGRSTERWTVKSTIYQLLISIQGLILVEEPYYNEPAYHEIKGRHSLQSKKYNSKTLKLVIDSMVNQIKNPPEIFKQQILSHYRNTGHSTHQRLQSYFSNNRKSNENLSKFPFDLSEGHRNNIENHLNTFLSQLNKLK